MPNCFDVSERTAQPVKQYTQRLSMVSDLYRRFGLTYILSPHLEGRNSTDSFDGTFERRWLSCQLSALLLSHLCQPKFDRRTPAIDHQNPHVKGEASEDTSAAFTYWTHQRYFE